jgi:RNA polymerase sigma-70 factor (ECF subfamily)
VRAAEEAMQCFDTVFREQAPFVRRALLRMGVADADVPDLLQEVFLVVLRRLNDFEGRSTLRTWLYGICLRVAAAQHRRLRRRRALFSLREADLALPARQDDACSVREHLSLLERCLARLSPEQRRVFVGFELEERTMAELAAELDCPVKTAFSRLHSARKRVNDGLARTTGAALIWSTPEAAIAKPAAASAGWVVGAGKPGAWLVGSALFASLWVTLPLPPTGLSLSVSSEPGRERPRDLSHFIAASARPAPPPDAPMPAPFQPPRVGRMPVPAPAAAAPQPAAALEVVTQELPSVSLHFERIALSEVVPVYWIRD